MTPQELYDHVARALLRQARPSGVLRGGTETFDCLYRSPDGCKCAAGHVIPDEKYSPGMEGETIMAVVVDYRLEDIREHVMLLRHLQQAHDNAARAVQGDAGAWLVAWKLRMRTVADCNGLSAAVLSETP